MTELAARPLAALILFAVAGTSVAAALLEGMKRHSTLARILLLFSCLANFGLLAVGWKPGMQPFRHPLVGLVLASSSAAFFTLFWSSAARGPRLHAAILVLASGVSFALAPALSWPWKQVSSPWFLWSEILYALSAGALWASAVRVDLSGAQGRSAQVKDPDLGEICSSHTRKAADPRAVDDSVSLHTVAVALVGQTLALLLLGIGAQVTWGHYWAWDPIESWRLAAWLATTALAIVLGELGWRRRRARLVTSLVAAFVLFVLWGSFPLVYWLGLLSAYLPN